MANETTGVASGSVEELIVELVAQDVIPKLRRKAVFQNVMRNYVWGGPSQVINVAQGDTLTFADLNEATANTYEEYTTTDRQLTPILVGTDLMLSWEALTHPSTSVHDALVNDISTAWAVYTDDAAAGLYTEASASTPTHEIGADGTALAVADVANVAQLLMTAGVPTGDNGAYALVVHPIQWQELGIDTTLVTNIMTGRGQLFATQGGEPTSEFFMGHVMGCDIWVSPSINESSGLHAIGMAPTALGVARKFVWTDDSPDPELLKVEWGWVRNRRAREYAITICEDVGGTSHTATTNEHMVDLKS